MQDKDLVCKDCGTTFTFTVGEQEFYKEKGFESDPIRCLACRRARKQSYNRNTYGGGQYSDTNNS